MCLGGLLLLRDFGEARVLGLKGDGSRSFCTNE